MFKPHNLQQTIGLATLQERAVENAQKKGKVVQRDPNSLPLLPTPKAITDRSIAEGDKNNSAASNNTTGRSFKKLSSGELEEKRKKGLCYWCDEKYTAGHNCRQKKLYSLEIVGEDDNEEVRETEYEEAETGGVTQEENSAMISLNALARIQSMVDYNTMRVSGSVQGHKVHILIDSRSTHNFIDSFTAAQLGCKMS